jgi:ABC-type Na+ transport system ATPase subunit NatA
MMKPPVKIGHHQQDMAEEDADVRAIRSVVVVDAGEVTVVDVDVDEEPKVVKDRLNVRLAMHLRMTTTHMCRMHWTMTTMKTGPSS